jgi:hypothetical protein
MWLASRLQMYWKSHATEIYNRGDIFDHAEGHAPVATVRYPGSRDPVTVYQAPRLEDIPPYEDDTRGVFLANSSMPGKPLEWASPAKSGRVVDGINSHILHLAAISAKLYWITGDERYARLAAPVLDTYLRGMYYRKEPVDLTHGHSQTIYGMSTFEVIQENNLLDIADTYDFLHEYLQLHYSAGLPIYNDAMRHWIDLTVRNGVPFNNWDLIEAQFIAAVALVLDDDSAYTDGHGAQYYLNYVLNESVTRQWSLSKLAARGFDPRTAIWFESPGYSMNVVKDFMELVNMLDAALGTDILQQLPVIERAVLATGQYLYPNGFTVSFGDAHHVLLSSTTAREMVKNAQLHHRRQQEMQFIAMAKLLEANAAAAGHVEALGRQQDLEAVLAPENEQLDPSIPAMNLSELVSMAFSAFNVSYFVQRNGLDPENGLMAAEAGSLGNHQHANGITLELYGRGLILAPESGIGTNYFQSDHAEYYSQFPAHNTVAIDGISSYPTMKSNHGFVVIGAWPKPEPASIPGASAPPAHVTYSEVYFHEPETDGDQRRLVSTIRTSSANGYYVDIFRSRRRDGKDRMHDYFFHGLGQSMTVTDAEHRSLPLAPTEELTFANEELPAYDYFWDKRSISYAGDYGVRFDLALPDREVRMNLWMAGSPDRVIFAVKAPASRAIGDMMPSEIASLPMPTLVVRQHGEAWTHPFVAIFEPTDREHPSAIASIKRFVPAGAPSDFVGLDVSNVDGSHQHIFSAVESSREVSDDGIDFQGSYAVCGESNSDRYLFLGNGWQLARDGIALEFADDQASAELQYGSPSWHLTTSEPGRILVAMQRLGSQRALQIEDAGNRPIWLAGSPVQFHGQAALQYDLPALRDAHLTWSASRTEAASHANPQ